MIVYPLRRCSYSQGLEIQEDLHSKVVAGALPPQVLLFEHQPVISMGKHADVGETRLEVPRHRSERGGQVTLHMPGQLLVYFILPVLGFGVRAFICWLEDGVIQYLRGIGICAERRSQYPGIWVQGKKICSVGVRIKQRVSSHGLAININADLDLFKEIIPCGIVNCPMVNLNDLVETVFTVESVAEGLVDFYRVTP